MVAYGPGLLRAFCFAGKKENASNVIEALLVYASELSHSLRNFSSNLRYMCLSYFYIIVQRQVI